MYFRIPERRTDLTTRSAIDAVISELRTTQTGIMYYHDLTHDAQCNGLQDRIEAELAYYVQLDRILESEAV